MVRRSEDEPMEARGVNMEKEEEMLPKGAKQVSKPSNEGNERDTAGQHGKMAPESAASLERAKGG